MKNFSTVMVKETLNLKRKKSDGSLETVEILNGRIRLDLKNSYDVITDNFVIRAHYMHHAAQLASKIIEEFEKGGSLKERPDAILWKEFFEDEMATRIDEHLFDDPWLVVYNNGEVLFKSKDTESLIDIVEKLDSKCRTYEEALFKMEETLQATGQNAQISHSTTTSMILDLQDGNEVHAGVLCKTPKKQTNITFFVSRIDDPRYPADEQKDLEIFPIVKVAASLIEGFKIAYDLGIWETEREYKKIVITEKMQDFLRLAPKRLNELRRDLNQLKTKVAMRFRPEEPEFETIQKEAENVIKHKYDPRKKKAKKSA